MTDHQQHDTVDISLTCDCGERLTIEDDNDRARCDGCGGLFAITVTRLAPGTC